MLSIHTSTAAWIVCDGGRAVGPVRPTGAMVKVLPRTALRLGQVLRLARTDIVCVGRVGEIEQEQALKGDCELHRGVYRYDGGVLSAVRVCETVRAAVVGGWVGCQHSNK